MPKVKITFPQVYWEEKEVEVSEEELEKLDTEGDGFSTELVWNNLSQHEKDNVPAGEKGLLESFYEDYAKVEKVKTYFEEIKERGYNTPIINVYNLTHDLSLVAFHWKHKTQGMDSREPQDVIDFIICKDESIERRKSEMYTRSLRFIKSYDDFINLSKTVTSLNSIVRLLPQEKHFSIRSETRNQEDFTYLTELVAAISKRFCINIPHEIDVSDFQDYVLKNLSITRTF